MVEVTRRAALGAIASLPAVGGAVAATSLAAGQSPVGRFQAAIDELKAAAKALDPNIDEWTINTNGHLECGILIGAFRKTTKHGEVRS